ncbi:hypothetical protein MKK69_30785 [Methylobacterium sp. J-026]|uniref:hypothetical protein n=1 Tax=Methylobacterium sp. J-026 TaxID=2836624 RepID=UPI001FBBE4C4|nr:hypothetical protein [Methylobacterium sp. J-026]MCJ2138391.1 hypothetical protein [Methylobacterium sp. J-026]
MAFGRKQRKESTGGAAAAGTLEHLRRDLDAASAEFDAAQREHQSLEDRRDDALASEDVAELEAHETAVGAVERRLAVAQTRHARLAGEVDAAEVEAEQARRRAFYAQAEQALAEARQVIADEYPAAAQALADILKRAGQLRSVAREANASLPDGAEPLDTVLEPGGFNGRLYADGNKLVTTRRVLVDKRTGEPAHPDVVRGPNLVEREVEVEREVPREPAIPHKGVIEFTNIPGFTAETYIYPAPAWGHARSGPVTETPRQHHV